MVVHTGERPHPTHKFIIRRIGLVNQEDCMSLQDVCIEHVADPDANILVVYEIPQHTNVFTISTFFAYVTTWY